MRRIVLSLLAGLAAVTAAPAQFPVQVAVPNAGPSYAPQVSSMEVAPYVGPLWTIDLQYLVYFVKPHTFNTGVLGRTANPDQSLGSGLVTTIGVDETGYVAEVGPGSKDRGPYNGFRLSATHALPVDFARTAYVELVGFWLPDQGSDRHLVSTPDGNPAILLPFTTAATSAVGPAGNYSVVVSGFADPNRVAGGVHAILGTQIWGGELNIAGPLVQGTNFGVEAIVGFRYLGLDDEFRLLALSNLGTGFFSDDYFRVSSHFFGPQAGARFIASNDRWAGMLVAKVGLGDSHSRLSISGSTLRPDSEAPGGLYTSAANIGKKTTDYFGVVVDLNFSVRFALTQMVGLSVGYNFLNWSGVVRAADQVPVAIDPSINAVLNPAGAVAATGNAEVRNRETDLSSLWMHGLNFGIDIRF